MLKSVNYILENDLRRLIKMRSSLITWLDVVFNNERTLRGERNIHSGESRPWQDACCFAGKALTLTPMRDVQPDKFNTGVGVR